MKLADPQCLSVCVSVCVCVCVHTPEFLNAFASFWISVHMYFCVCAHLSLCVLLFMRVCVCVCVCAGSWTCSPTGSRWEASGQ